MSKAHMIVLNFLNRKPMYGYQIGQIVEQHRMPAWSGVKLAAIYKSMQNMERQRYIKGEEQREGNNPPRTVYHITSRGKEHLRQLIIKALGDVQSFPTDWWMALSLAKNSISRPDMLNSVELRLKHLTQVVMKKCQEAEHLNDLVEDERPFVADEALMLGKMWIKDEIKVLKALRQAIQDGKYDAGFYDRGEGK